MFDWISVLLGTIVVGVVTNAIWEWLRDTVTLPSSRYVNMRGHWKSCGIMRMPDGSTFEINETWDVKQQFGRRFSGVIVTPHPDSTQGTYCLRFKGEFKSKFLVAFFYEHPTPRLTDIGAGLMHIEADHNRVQGGSVNFGVSSQQYPVLISFTANRVT
jgi:hypothetical protein